MGDGRGRATFRNPAMRFASMGLELVAAIAGMLLLGMLLDRAFGSKPWLAIVGVSVGAVGGMYNFIRTATRETRRENAAYLRDHSKRVPADGAGDGRKEGPDA